jgi:hypothetical protein
MHVLIPHDYHVEGGATIAASKIAASKPMQEEGHA